MILRRLASALVATLGTVLATPADALAPCNDTCHLAQGTPLLLTDVRELWIRQCLGAEDDVKCVVKRTTLEGKQLEQRAAPSLFDHDFQERKLGKHTLVGLDHKGAWTDLRKPFPLGPFEDEAATTVRLDGASLILTTKRKPEARRTFPCKPTRLTVHAGAAKTALGAVVVTARCPTAAGVDGDVSVSFGVERADLTSF